MIRTKTFAIIGGGIGGLSLAIALQRRGISVNVYESAPEIKAVGAGIVLAANALKAFRSIGLESDIQAAGNVMRRFSIRNQKGKVLTTTETERVRSRWGAVNTLTLHRADLHNVLMNALIPETLHLGKACKGFTSAASGITMHFKDGSVETADYLIAADGIHSLFRQHFLPDSQPRYAGYTCWRGVAHAIPSGFDSQEAFETWGSGKRFGVVPLAGNRIYWYATLNAKKDDPAFRDYGASELTRLFDGFHDPIQDIISSTSAEKIVRNDIIDIKPILKFAFGRVVLSGDAAHATTPNMGQGACMAIEDAVVLGNCIAAGTDPEEAFRKYEHLRISRTTRIVNMSHTLGKVSQLEGGMLVALRNAAMRLTPQRVSDKQLDFLFSIDFHTHV